MMDLVIVFGSSSVPHHHHRLCCAAAPEPNRKTKSTSSLTKQLPSLPHQRHSASPASVSSSANPLSTHFPDAVRWIPDGSVEYYADFASKLAEDGRIQDVALIAETLAAESGANVARFASMVDSDLLSKGISLNLRQGKIESVVYTLKRIEKVGIAPLDLVDESSVKLMRKQFRAMANSVQVEKAIDLMEILAGFRFKIKDLVDPFDVVKICVDISNPQLAIRYACLLPHTDILLCRIIHGFGKKGDMVSVITAYEACKQILDNPNMYIYRTMIDVCGLCGDYVKSRYIYEDLLKENIKPNVYVMNSLMNVNSHDLGYTLQVYKNMQKLDVTADMTSYNILLKTCCLAGRVDLAQDIYKEAKRMESSGLLKLDAFTYCTIIKVFADAKMWKMALKVKDDMQSVGVTPNTHTWSSLISACANAGLVEQANHLFEEMLASGCEPNSQCFNILLHACVEACQYDRAFRLFYSWKGSSVKEALFADDIVSKGGISSPNKLENHGPGSLMNSNSTSPYIRASNKFFFKPTTATYNILLKACGTDYYRGKELMDEMKSLGLAPNQITWSTLIDICGGSGDVEGAVRILRTMHSAGSRPDVVAYTTAIKICAENKSLKLAFSLFEEMRRYQIKPNWVTYNTLLKARSKYGSLLEVRQCLAIYQDMREAGYKPNDHFLKELIEEWCEGVIQENGQSRYKTSDHEGTNLGRPVSLLIEKVATHVQERTAGNLAIDLQGLTKVEARLVVLAVLRMIKEDYMRGDVVSDDMLIIIGAGEASTDSGKQEIAVKDVLVKLLKDELSLVVLPAGQRHVLDITQDARCVDDAEQDPEHTPEDTKSFVDLSSTRRPAILERLMVTKASLHQWLQRRK